MTEIAPVAAVVGRVVPSQRLGSTDGLRSATSHAYGGRRKDQVGDAECDAANRAVLGARRGAALGW